jgi:hypothetical protein
MGSVPEGTVWDVSRQVLPFHAWGQWSKSALLPDTQSSVSKEVELEVNTENTKYVERTERQSHNLNVD